jgi:hypothetical protein
VNYTRIAEMLSDAIASDAEGEEEAKFVVSYCLKVTLETACYRCAFGIAKRCSVLSAICSVLSAICIRRLGEVVGTMACHMILCLNFSP